MDTPTAYAELDAIADALAKYTANLIEKNRQLRATLLEIADAEGHNLTPQQCADLAVKALTIHHQP